MRTFTTYFLTICELSEHVLRSPLLCHKCMCMNECMPYTMEYYNYRNFLDMSQSSVVRLNSLRSTGVVIVGGRSAGIGIAGVRSAGIRRRSRGACQRQAPLLVTNKSAKTKKCCYKLHTFTNQISNSRTLQPGESKLEPVDQPALVHGRSVSSYSFSHQKYTRLGRSILCKKLTESQYGGHFLLWMH